MTANYNSEKFLEFEFRRRVRLMGGECLKFKSYEVGVPDRVCILPGGLSVFIEFKSKNGVYSPAQNLWAKRFKELGILYFRVFSEESFLRVLEHLKLHSNALHG
jgi:hypothetical protein